MLGKRKEINGSVAAVRPQTTNLFGQKKLLFSKFHNQVKQAHSAV